MAIGMNDNQNRIDKENDSEDSLSKDVGSKKTVYIRNLVAFWFLGLCNNYAYVIMLSAAHDILSEEKSDSDDANSTVTTPAPSNVTRECNALSTGAILLADIVPALFIKFLSPFLPMYTQVRVVIVIVLAFASFLLPALTKIQALAFLGVVCASLSSGLGEVTFLSYSSHFNKNVVSTWSSGTGGSGVFGALSYAGFTSAGLSPRHTLLVMLVVPVIMALSFWLVLVHPGKSASRLKEAPREDLQPLLDEPFHSDTNQITEVDYVPSKTSMSVKTKFKIIRSLLPYMIPLTVVYFAEYFINQGLQELMYFKNAWLSQSAQYRWYQVDYQIGVFISRSSVNIVQIKKTWIMPIIQFVNLALVLTHVLFDYFPNIWVAFVIIFVEGLIGGCAYVNTFYRLSEEISDDKKEFCMGAASMSDSVGIAVAGAIAVPIHDVLCRRPA